MYNVPAVHSLGSLGTGISESCESTGRDWELNRGLLQEQQVLLTPEPCLLSLPVHLSSHGIPCVVGIRQGPGRTSPQQALGSRESRAQLSLCSARTCLCLWANFFSSELQCLHLRNGDERVLPSCYKTRRAVSACQRLKECLHSASIKSVPPLFLPVPSVFYNANIQKVHVHAYPHTYTSMVVFQRPEIFIHIVVLCPWSTGFWTPTSTPITKSSSLCKMTQDLLTMFSLFQTTSKTQHDVNAVWLMRWSNELFQGITCGKGLYSIVSFSGHAGLNLFTENLERCRAGCRQ